MSWSARSLSQTADDAIAEDEFADAFPGLTLTHLLTVASRDELTTTIEALQVIRASGGILEFFRLTRRDNGLEHRLKIAGLCPRQARLLSSRLAALPGVERATVEHQLMR
jgi:hypothetical protein